MIQVYGDMLAHFPELLYDHEVFFMPPKLRAGYGERVVKFIVRGYIARDRAGYMAHASELLTENQLATFYAYADIPRGDIRKGLFTEDNGQLFRFTASMVYAREGGCSQYILQLVTGNTDKQVPHDAENIGPGEFQ